MIIVARPDEGTVRTALTLAIRAPSNHNSQPWRWLIGTDSLQLFADPDRSLPATDPDRRDLVVSCGAALHHARVGFAALGWATTVHRLPNPRNPFLLATLEFRPSVPTAADLATARAIADRRSDRRRFSSWPVPADQLETLANRAVRQGSILVPVSEPDQRLRLEHAIAEANRRQTRDPAYAEELAFWSGRGSADVDGVPAANTPAAAQVRGGTELRTFPYGHLSETDRTEPDAGELVIVGTSSDDGESRLRAGEGLSAVLLAATELSLATCVLSPALEVYETRRLVRDQVLDGVAEPQAVVRVGWAPVSSEPLPVTPRRPLDDVLGRQSD